VLIGKAQLGGDLGDGSHFGFLCDLDIGFHQTSSFGSRFYKHCTPPERPFCSHPALLSLAIRQDCCEKSPCLRAKNPAIQRTLLIETTSDNKKGSFAQQLRKAAQTVGIDSPAIPALWCSTRFRQQRYGLYAVKIAQCRGVCQGKTYTNLSGRGPSILLRKTVLSLKSPTFMLQNPELHYLDNAATTMVAPEVADVIDKAMREHWANPSSLYGPGARSEEALNAARAAVARTLGCKSKELYFTSCGSESNNLALLGAVRTRTFGKGIVVSGFEHPSVQRPLEELAKQGYNVTVVKPRPDGTLNINEMLEHVDKNTILVACMMVNNEVGTRNDVERLAAEVKRRNSRTIVHVDAVQAWMRVPIKLTNIDTLSVSGHKIHAPKGIGALYLSDRLVQAFRPPYLGGEQERGLRPGTENLPYAMGLAAAATRLAKTMKSRDTAMKALNQRLRDGLKAFPEVEINSPENAVPEVLNFSEMCIKSETMLAWLAEAQVYVSSASACGRGQPSHTLAAMGKDPLAIDTAIRVSFCGDNTPEDVDAFLNRFEDGMKHLQKIRK